MRKEKRRKGREGKKRKRNECVLFPHVLLFFVDPIGQSHFLKLLFTIYKSKKLRQANSVVTVV